MSDDQADADFEASLANLDGADGDAADDLAALGAGSDSLANRVETLQGTVSTLGMRIDALVTSTTTYRSALTDRLAEYSELVTKTARNQASDLEEYRKTAERTVTEVRRTLAESEEAMERLATKVEDLARSADGDDGESRRVISEVRSILEAQDRFSSFMRQSFEQFNAGVVDRLDGTQQESLDAIRELQAKVADLTGRDATAGLREDVAQLRAVVDAIAEHDVRAGVTELRQAVADLAGRDVAAELREELEQLRRIVSDLADRDVAGAVQAEIQPLREGVDRVASGLADDSAHQALLERFAHLESRLDALGQVDERIGAIDARLGAVATESQLRGLAADLRAHVADALGGLDGRALRDDLASMTEHSASDREAVATTLERLHETLLDVASGEVVGALWDEFRALRDDLAAGGGDDDGADVAAALQALHERTDSVAQAVRAELDARAERDQSLQDGVRTSLDELRALSAAVTDLAAGSATAPAPVADLSGIDELREQVSIVLDAVRHPSAAPASTEFAELRDGVQRLTDEVRELLEAAEVEDYDDDRDAAAETPAPIDDARLVALSEDVSKLRTELHEGLAVEPSPELLDTLTRLQEDLHEGLAVEPSPELLEALQELRDGMADIRSTLERVPAIEERVSEKIDGFLESLEVVPEDLPEDDAAPVPAADPDSRSGGGLDEAALDALKEEIRAAGGVSDEVLEALRTELTALRRRISVKAAEKVLSDEQLQIIADAVADRLAKG